MGRPKTYDRTEVLERALRVFWERGYHAASTRELSDAMGLNPYSLYAEFGSKEALYEAVLERYDARVVQGHFGRLEGPDASLEQIREVLDFFGAGATYTDSWLGCLLCNAATERAPTEAVSRLTSAAYVGRLTAGFANALRNAAAEGRLVDDAPVDELAAFFTTVMLGMFVLMRSEAGDGPLRAAARQGRAHLDTVTRA